MTRNTDIDKILFPVELSDIFYFVKKKYGQPGLFESEDKELKTIEGYQAVTNSKTGRVFSVVTEGYRLVSNQEAMDLARDSFKQLFGVTDTGQMEVFNIITPQSLSFCHIDLVHRGYAVNIWASEMWLPYLRVTNSYNRSRALHFDLGFCRKLCDNGVIFESETIHYKFFHTRQQITPAGQFQVNFEKLKLLETRFSETVKGLNAYHVPRKAFLPMACAALELTFDTHSEDASRRAKEKQRLDDFKYGARELADKYANELHENAYAVFNLITDLASRPFFFRSSTIMVDNLQKKAGSWLGTFFHEIRRSDFSLDKYLGNAVDWFSLN
ncbi:MAG: DUF932 domain-containing protein [Chloroflexi bacterium]|nr:DUF932 domain-containing protein [Chloroflexota bacterium]